MALGIGGIRPDRPAVSFQPTGRFLSRLGDHIGRRPRGARQFARAMRST